MREKNTPYGAQIFRIWGLKSEILDLEIQILKILEIEQFCSIFELDFRARSSLLYGKPVFTVFSGFQEIA